MLEHRLPILLDEERYRRVASAAERRGVSIAAVIRAAIDELPDSDSARRHAIAAFLAAEPMPVPLDPTELRRELDAAHDRASR